MVLKPIYIFKVFIPRCRAQVCEREGRGRGVLPGSLYLAAVMFVMLQRPTEPTQVDVTKSAEKEMCIFQVSRTLCFTLSSDFGWPQSTEKQTEGGEREKDTAGGGGRQDRRQCDACENAKTSKIKKIHTIFTVIYVCGDYNIIFKYILQFVPVTFECTVSNYSMIGSGVCAKPMPRSLRGISIVYIYAVGYNGSLLHVSAPRRGLLLTV